MDRLVENLISQGGWAVLAGFLGILGYKLHQQAQDLLRQIIGLVKEISGAIATLAGAIEGLRSEVAGLRQGQHGIRELMTGFEARLYELERPPREARR